MAMNFSAGLLAAIAAVLSLIAIILFGRPQADDSASQSTPPTTQVEPIVPPPLSPVSPPAAPITTPTATPIAIADPWADDTAPTQTLPTAPTLSPVPMARMTLANTADPTGQRTTPSMPPFAAIHDPKRPSTPGLQDLSQDILAFGQPSQWQNLPKLMAYAKHSDAKIRVYVAYAIGQVIQAPRLGSTVPTETATVIPVLQQLSQDSDGAVRQMATKVMRQIQAA
jgi:hypothetical protein